MNSSGNKASAGGAATTSGTRFQEEVARWFACFILAESGADLPLGLPSAHSLADILAETCHPIDDLQIGLSNGGRILVQAKTNLSLSDGTESTLASVALQFVSQYQQGLRTEGGATRYPDLRDRFVLAVSQDTSATIRSNLKDALDRVRSAGTVEAYGSICEAMSIGLRRALETFSGHIDRIWQASAGSPPAPDAKAALLKLCYVLPLDFTGDGHSEREGRQLLRQHVVARGDQIDLAWGCLLETIRRFSPERTGGDREFLCQELARAGVRLRSTPSFVGVIDSAKRLSLERLGYLRSLSHLRYAGEDIVIQRPADRVLEEAAKAGHVLVTGPPGGGKSGCLYHFASRHADTDMLLIVVDQLVATGAGANLDSASAQPGVALATLLANWEGDGPGYLVIDALDAARAAASLESICKTLQVVMDTAPRWHVVASIREFDLEKSRTLQRLFRGEPPSAEHCSDRFGRARHVSVQPLTDDEIGYVSRRIPDLSQLWERSPNEFRALLRNVFNLDLMVQLLEDNVAVEQLSPIRSQIELLDLYWQERVTNHDPDLAQERAAESVVARMFESVSLNVAARDLGSVPAAGVHTATGRLCEAGVMVSQPNGPSPLDARLAFAHNIIFDYAAARLWVGELPREKLSLLEHEGKRMLVLALRPSFVMAFELLWRRGARRELFWERALALFGSPGIALVGKIIPAEVAAEEYETLNDMVRLLAAVEEGAPEAIILLRHTVSAALAFHDLRSDSFQLSGPNAHGEWIELAGKLTTLGMSRTAWQVKALLGHLALSDTPLELTGEQETCAIEGAKALVLHGLEPGVHHLLARVGVEVLTRLMPQAGQETVNVLRRCLDHEHEDSWYDLLRPICERIGSVARVDEEFALLVVRTAFSHSGDRNESVPSGGRIMSFSFNRHDLADMLSHAIAENFAALMSEFPLFGTKALIAALEADHKLQRDRPDKEDIRTYAFPLRGGEATLRTDWSCIWAESSSSEHENWAKLLLAFRSYLGEASSEDLRTVCEELAAGNAMAVIWRALLDAAASRGEPLGTMVWEMLTSEAILTCDDTREPAARAITSIHPLLSPEQREAIESAIMAIPLGEDSEGTMRDRVLGCVPMTSVVTERARRRLQEMCDAGGPPKTVPPLASWGARHISEDEYLERHDGIPLSEPQNKTVLALTRSVESFARDTGEQGHLTVIDAEAFFPKVEALLSLLGDSGGQPVHPKLRQEGYHTVIAWCEQIALAEGPTSSAVSPFVRHQLLQAATESQPEYNPESDRRWDGSTASWGSPSPRINAASGLMALARGSSSPDGDIIAAIRRLAADPVHAVRYHISCHLLRLRQTCPDLMWELAERFAADEERLVVLQDLIHYFFLQLFPSELERGEALVDSIYGRVADRPESDGVRKACAVFFFRRELWDASAVAQKRISDLLDAPSEHSDELSELVHLCHDDLLTGEEQRGTPDGPLLVREWGVSFLSRVTSSCLAELGRMRGDLGLDYGTWDEEQREAFRRVASVVNAVARTLIASCGAQEERSGKEWGKGKLTGERLCRFADDIDPILDGLCGVGSSHTAYEVLQLIHHLVPARPERALLHISNLVRCAREDAFHHESLAADLVVTIVEQYLVEYRTLFRESVLAQNALIGVLDAFVEAGWPKALQLSYRLSEVFR